MGGFRDWQQLGVFPLQDHDKKIPISLRQQLVGGRIVTLQDPDENAGSRSGLVVYGRESGMGTLGDIHPWMFWQTAMRHFREMGSWAMSFPSITMEGCLGGYGKGGTGTFVSGTRILPIREADYKYDARYAPMAPGWPISLPSIPRGSLMIAAPGTKEDQQHNIMLHADPRIVAPNVSGPGEAGTLVVDLQPEGELCMSNSVLPGVGGRHARFQSLTRVIALPGTGGLPGLGGIGNILALQYGRTGADGISSFGAVYGPMVGDAPPKGPITPGWEPGDTVPPRTPPKGPITPGQGGASFSLASLDEPDKQWKFTDGQPTSSSKGGQYKKPKDTPPPTEPQAKTPRQFGQFIPSGTKNHGVALMAHLGSYGPIHTGSTMDKHQFGYDADGHPINSAHISVDAYFFDDNDRDGPFLFEGRYPYPPPWPLKARTHLTWDPALDHLWAGGIREGKWRWWTEVPYIAPNTGPPTTEPEPVPIEKKPRWPGGPGPPTPGPGGPGKPEPGKPGKPGFPGGPVTPEPNPPQVKKDPLPTPITPPTGTWPPKPIKTPNGVWPNWDETREQDGKPGSAHGIFQQVGDIQPDDRAAYTILHPMHESFAAIGFRPQLWQRGATSYEHNPWLDAGELERDEQTRPQVLSMRPWGAQTGSGDWDYVTRPKGSRARGGIVNGGVLLSPPEFEMEDYLGLESTADVEAPSSTAYLCLAPGVLLAFGVPATDGGLDAGAVTWRRDLTDPKKPIVMEQLNASGTPVEVFRAIVDSSSGEVVPVLGGGGTQAIRIPLGVVGETPTVITPVGGEIRMLSSGLGVADRPQYWDTDSSTWLTVANTPDLLAYLLIDGTRAMTGALQLIAGAAGTPSVYFGSDSTTGLFRSGSDAIGFQNAGTENMTLNSAGNLLVGSTTDLGGKVQVITAAGGTGLELRSTDSNATQKLGFLTCTHYTNTTAPFGLVFGDADATTNTISIGGGNAGVVAATIGKLFAAANSSTTTGTAIVCWDPTGVMVNPAGATAPSYPLHVVGGAASIGIVVGVTGSASHGLYASSVSGRGAWIQQSGALAANTSYNTLLVYRNHTLGAFTSTGAVLLVHDNVSSTGPLQLWKYSTVEVAKLTSVGFAFNPTGVSSPTYAFEIWNAAGLFDRSGAGIQQNLILRNTQAAADGVGPSLDFIGVGPTTMATISATWAAAATTNSVLDFSVRAGGSAQATLRLNQYGGRIDNGVAADPGYCWEVGGEALFEGSILFTGTAGLHHGNIYVEDNSTATTISASSTWYQVLVFTADGEAFGCTNSYGDGHIEVDRDGLYLVMLACSILSGAGTGFTAEVEVKLNNGATSCPNVHFDRTLAGGGGDVGSGSAMGTMSLTAGDTVEVWVQNKTNTTDITFEDISLSVVCIGA